MIDDGTGILACQCWFNQGPSRRQILWFSYSHFFHVYLHIFTHATTTCLRHNSSSMTGSGGAQFDRTSANILVSLCDEAGNPTPLPQGTLVSIQGRLSAWRGSLEISVHHCKVRNISLYFVVNSCRHYMPFVIRHCFPRHFHV